MDTPQTKSLLLKCPDLSDAEGRVSLKVATLGVIDRDGDVIVAGAVGRKEVLLGPFQHRIMQGAPPIGRGVLYEQDGELRFDGQFNLEMTSAQETFSAMRFAPELTEVSFGFYTVKQSPGMVGTTPANFLEELDPFEVSPVLRGAGIGTGVRDIKSAEEPAPAVALPSADIIVAQMALSRLPKEFSGG